MCASVFVARDARVRCRVLDAGCSNVLQLQQIPYGSIRTKKDETFVIAPRTFSASALQHSFACFRFVRVFRVPGTEEWQVPEGGQIPGAGIHQCGTRIVLLAVVG